jgi:hypothetical protein
VKERPQPADDKTQKVVDNDAGARAMVLFFLRQKRQGRAREVNPQRGQWKVCTSSIIKNGRLVGALLRIDHLLRQGRVETLFSLPIAYTTAARVERIDGPFPRPRRLPTDR